MLSSEENPGLFTIVIGVIALVLVGVGLSVMRDKQTKSGKNPSLSRVIGENSAEIAKLTEDRATEQRHFERLREESEKDNISLAEANAELTKLDSRLATLSEDRALLRRSVEGLEAELEALEQQSKTPAPRETPTAPLPAQPNPELEQARAEVRTAALRVSTLAGRLAEAQSNVSRGITNVPGSLKTWKEVHAYLTKDLATARANLLAKGNKLRSIAPTDPLLRTTPGV